MLGLFLFVLMCLRVTVPGLQLVHTDNPFAPPILGASEGAEFVRARQLLEGPRGTGWHVLAGQGPSEMSQALLSLLPSTSVAEVAAMPGQSSGSGLGSEQAWRALRTLASLQSPREIGVGLVDLQAHRLAQAFRFSDGQPSRAA